MASGLTPNETPHICTPCGGRCCKSVPGAYHPDQLPLDQALSSLQYIRTTRQGDGVGEEVYMVRPPRVYEVGLGDDSSLSSAPSPRNHDCLHLTPTGCRLSFQDRPYECQALRAVYPLPCQQDPATRAELVRAWGDVTEITIL